MNSQNVLQLVDVLSETPRLIPDVSRAKFTLVSTSDLSSGRANAGVKKKNKPKRTIRFIETMLRVRVKPVNFTCKFVCTMREGVYNNAAT